MGLGKQGNPDYQDVVLTDAACAGGLAVGDRMLDVERRDAPGEARIKRLIVLILSMTTVLVLIGPVGSVDAVTSTSRSLAESATCEFTVTFTWSGFSGRSDVAGIRLDS